ncbi:MAG: ABC transporter permease, partial [Acidobacteriota bacterium]
MIDDLRHALRSLLRAPLFTFIAVATLVLGIGANTAIFSIVNAVLLRPLPFTNPERLVRLYSTSADSQNGNVNPLDALDWRDQNHSFQQMALFHDNEMTVSTGAEPVRIAAGRVTWDFFSMLGVKPQLGREFRRDEEKPGNDRVAIISNAFWLTWFGGAPDVIGKQIHVGDRQYEVVGVLPAGFRTPVVIRGEPAVYRPMALDPEQTGRGGHYMQVIARLRPGVSIRQAQEEVTALTEDIERRFPDEGTGRRARLEPLTETIVGDYRKSLNILMLAVGFVLLISCANVGALFLARAATRQREVSIRAALGAGRWRLIRQAFAEALIIALVGGTVAIAAGAWLASLIASSGSAFVPRLDSVGVDLPVLLFTTAAAIGSAFLFGLLPALQFAVTRPVSALQASGRGVTGARDVRRILRWMIVAEVALSIVLLTGAGLLIRSLWTLSSVQPGFDVDRILFVPVSLSPQRYSEDSKVYGFYEELDRRLERYPQIQSSGATNILPFSGSFSCDGFTMEGDPEIERSLYPCAEVRAVSERYFQTMGIPLVAGRFFAPVDTPASTPAVIINRSLAVRLGGNPIGRHIRTGKIEQGKWGTIVGVSGDVRHFALDKEPTPELYLLSRQEPFYSMTVVVRVNGRMKDTIPIVRSELQALDPTLPLNALEPMASLVDRSLGESRLRVILFGSFAALALLLAATGIYGILSHGVANRTRELGVRVALGADAGQVFSAVLGESMKMTLLGVVVGLAGAMASVRLIESFLYGISPVDPISLLAAAGLLTAVALCASLAPARRAMKIDPVAALRAE